jgi:beta-N-acetylhexosaminidase
VLAPPPLTIPKAVGQMIIATYQGIKPPVSILNAIRSGQIGSVILMGDNTAAGVSVTRAATTTLQRAARAGGNPGLLIMTDQEGGLVKRLPGPPDYAASQMSNPKRAANQGYATALVLRKAGVNLDLAPVADVSVINGFMTKQRRTFGHTPATVANAACAFARGLVRGGVAYTLKHFPGLGGAQRSTDDVPVDVTQSAAAIYADDAAYRACGHGPLAVVMVSSASYKNLTGTLPAVLSPRIYGPVMRQNGINGLTISDSLESGAIAPWPTPARRAIAAGLDMVMYANQEADALNAYTDLLADVRSGSLSSARVKAAATKVLALKRTLGLTP